MGNRKLKCLTISPTVAESRVGCPRPLSVDEAATWAGVSRNTIYKLCKQGMLGRRVNRIYHIGQHELAQLFLSEADRERIGWFQRMAQNGRRSPSAIGPVGSGAPSPTIPAVVKAPAPREGP